MSKNTIFLDGKMVKASDALIDSLAPGIVRGQGVFETMHYLNGQIFELDRHWERLFRGLKNLRVRSPHTRKRLEQYLFKTIRANRFKEARVRLAIWKEGCRLRSAIVCQKHKGYLENKYNKGFNAVVSNARRTKTRYSHIKSMDYACFREALAEARRRKCDEAILLNNRRELVEGSRSNIFFVKKGILYTPAVRSGALNGITRQIVIQCARQEGIPCRAVGAGVRQLTEADEAFVTNSLIGVMPLTAVDGKSIGRGVGPLTHRLLSAYRKRLSPQR